MLEGSPTRHRFFVDSGRLGVEAVELDGARAHQMARVLRLRPGDQIVLLDGSGREQDVELVQVTPHRVRGNVRATRPSRGEPRLAITLYQALVAREKLEVVLQKGTEVGVSRFVPVRCERSLPARGDGIDERRLDRWRRIVQEAAEQSRRGRLPVVDPPMRWDEALAGASADGPTLVAWEGELVRSVRAAVRALLAPIPPDGGPAAGGRHLSLFVGPEGGLSNAEVARAPELGALTVSLGPRILRTETAGPILAALVLYEAGDLEPPCQGRSAS